MKWQLVGNIKGRDGENGASAVPVNMADVAEMVRQEVAAAIKALPPARDGRDGSDGSSVSIEDVRSLIASEVGVAIAAFDVEQVRGMLQTMVDALPKPKDGVDGKPGLDGKTPDIEDVKRVVDPYMARIELDINRQANDTLQRAIDKIPAPKDGKDGRDGTDGANGKDGTNGRDGLGFDDMTVEYDGVRTVSLIFKRGETERRRDLVLPIVLDAGVFDDGKKYERGDGVTHGGSFWIAQRDNPEGRPGTSQERRLATKKGRDGKDGAAGPQGPKGDPGMDRRYE